MNDAASYLITAQVGLVAVVSVAVGLVTLIAQRDDRSSSNTDIQLYYDGSLAYEVVASSVALLLVLEISCDLTAAWEGPSSDKPPIAG